MQIELTIKNVYGCERIYVSNEEQARIISRLTGKATIDRGDIACLKQLGCQFEVLAPAL